MLAALLLLAEGEVMSPQPLSNALVCTGTGLGGEKELCFGGCWGAGAGAGAGAGSGVAQALLLPQASILFSAPKAELDDWAGGEVGAAGFAG